MDRIGFLCCVLMDAFLIFIRLPCGRGRPCPQGLVDLGYFQGFTAAAFLPATLPKTMHSVRFPPPW